MLRAEIQTTHQLSTALELHQQKQFSLDLTAMKHLVRNLHRSISKAEFEQVCPWWLDSRRTSTACHHLECKRRSRLELTIHPGKKLNIFNFWKIRRESWNSFEFVMIFCWLDRQMLRVSVKRARKRFRDPSVKCTVYINKAPSNGLRDVAGLRNWVVHKCKQKNVILSKILILSFHEFFVDTTCPGLLCKISTTLKNNSSNRYEEKSVQ